MLPSLVCLRTGSGHHCLPVLWGPLRLRTLAVLVSRAVSSTPWSEACQASPATWAAFLVSWRGQVTVQGPPSAVGVIQGRVLY